MIGILAYIFLPHRDTPFRNLRGNPLDERTLGTFTGAVIGIGAVAGALIVC